MYTARTGQLAVVQLLLNSDAHVHALYSDDGEVLDLAMQSQAEEGKQVA